MLAEIYESYRRAQTAQLLEVSNTFFVPLLVQEPEDWRAAKNRIAFIGQETLDWKFGAEDASMYNYEWNCPD